MITRNEPAMEKETTNLRNPGYYWVKVDNEWSVFHYYGNLWWGTGYESSTDENYLQEIDSEPITRNEPAMDIEDRGVTAALNASNFLLKFAMGMINGKSDDLVQMDLKNAEDHFNLIRNEPAMEKEKIEEMRETIARLKAFKEYVHKRLDDMGIPVNPESSHKIHGCRIGGRLDIVEQLSRNEAITSELVECLKEILPIAQERINILNFASVNDEKKERFNSIVDKAESLITKAEQLKPE